MIYKHHGDTKISANVSVVSESGLDDLTKKYALFNNNEQTAHAVVLSTPHIKNERHNLKAQIRHHENLTTKANRMIVHNFMPVNRWTIKSGYRMHHLEDVINTLIAPDYETYFSFDASNSYWAIP